ncbi:MAG: ATP-binding protein [Deltaproteobacteria bacterium]|nr:ATP-binding protein [Deltaproteobacteria bacterium]
MALKPWFNVVPPREDLRDGRPLDASEFAVHLDHVRDGRAPADYQEPRRFFDRNFFAKNLTELAVSVVRRLCGIKVETSAVYNLTTQFGGGKTHALTLLYHLAKGGPAAAEWKGVANILKTAEVDAVPASTVAVFVGTEFDSITGRGGKDGTPLRRTPWGEIAFQLAGKAGFEVVAEHEERRTAPGGDVIRAFLPKDRPAVILMDELLNYMGRNRKSGLTGELYRFVQNLSEEARAQDRVVLVVSLPSLVDEMTPEDEADFDRFEKLLDRLGKAMIMSAEAETSEIIRRRLFEWSGLPADGQKTAAAYADWIVEHRTQVPSWFPVDSAKKQFADTYPFHPALLSVFERKWQALPRFQQTRGILRLLALWVSHAYQDGFTRNRKDPLIGTGTAPLDDPMFRSAIFEQLGGAKLEGAVTTDIAGKPDANAIRLDKEAVDTIRKARLHQKVATTIFFESNGGQAKAEATLPEIRLAVAEPDLDIGNVETAVEALASTCYFLSAEKNRYRFSLSPNLNKLLADRRASVQPKRIDERVRADVQKVFDAAKGDKPIYFPEKSGLIPDYAGLTLVVLAPEQCIADKATLEFVEVATREHGASGRTFKSALIWVIAEGPDALRDEARKVLAWEDIEDEQDELRLDDGQKRQLAENVKKAERDLRETVWRTYKNVRLLTKGNQWKPVDLGLVHSSAAESLVALILSRLEKEDELVKGVSPNLLTKSWPGGRTEWSTKSVRDAFFASPELPRLLNPDSIKDTIARGVESGLIGYVGKTERGAYEPFCFATSLVAANVEIRDDMFIIKADEARKHIEPPHLATVLISPQGVRIEPGKKQAFVASGRDQHGRNFAPGEVQWHATGGTIDAEGVFLAGKDEGSFVVTAKAGQISGSATFSISSGKEPLPSPPLPETKGLSWSGDVPPQKWMNFYTKVLSRFATGKDHKLTLRVEFTAGGSVSEQQVEETKVALRELGLDDDVRSH